MNNDKTYTMRICHIIYILFSGTICLSIAFLDVIKCTNILMYQLLSIYLFIICLTFLERNFSLYQIFLVTFFLFLVSRVFLHCIGAFDAHRLTLYESAYMNNDLLNSTIKTITVFLIGTSYAWLISINIKKDKNYFLHVPHTLNNRIISFVQKLFYIYIIIWSCKQIYLIYIMYAHGYVARSNGVLSSIDMPFIFTGAGTIAEILAVILFFYRRDLISFKHNALLFMFAVALGTLTGRRAPILIYTLFFIYIYSTYYKEIYIFNKKIILLATIVPWGIELIAKFRYHHPISLVDMLINNVYYTVLVTQGSIFNVVANTIKYNDVFQNAVPFFLGYFVDLFAVEPPGQVIEDIQLGNYLGDHLTYLINAKLFFMGRGTGTSIVAEAYNLCNGNFILIFFFACVITLIVLYICKRGYSSIINFCLMFYIAPRFIFSPRGALFSNLKFLYIALVLIFILYLLNASYSAIRTEK